MYEYYDKECSCDVYFDGNESALAKVAEFINDFMGVSPSEQTKELLKKYDIDDMTHFVDFNDYKEDADELYFVNEGKSLFATIISDYQDDEFLRLLMKEFEGVKVYYLSITEELGELWSNDVDKVHFKKTFLAENDSYGELYETEEEALEDLSEYAGVEFKDYEEMYEYAEKTRDWLHIHEVQYENLLSNK